LRATLIETTASLGFKQIDR